MHIIQPTTSRHSAGHGDRLVGPDFVTSAITSFVSNQGPLFHFGVEPLRRA
jgi:hypothetical protein